MSSSRFTCVICDVYCDSEKQLEFHESGKKHRSKCERIFMNNGISLLGRNPVITTPRQTTPQGRTSVTEIPADKSLTNDSGLILPDQDNTGSSGETKEFYCSPCSVRVNSLDQYNDHLKGQKHQKKVKSEASTPMDLETNIASPQPTKETAVPLSPYKLDIDILDLSVPSTAINDLHHAAQSNVKPSIGCARTFTRTCREYLDQIWPGVSFTREEADTLLLASDCIEDCVLFLIDTADAWFRVGIHLLTALLTANHHIQPTYAVWISTSLDRGPEPELFSPFVFPMYCTGRSERTLRISPALVEIFPSDCDLFLADADYFCTTLSNMLFQQNQLSCIIIQDASALAAHFQLSSLLSDYLEQFPNPVNRARIICLTSNPLPQGCFFKQFRTIQFCSEP